MATPARHWTEFDYLECHVKGHVEIRTSEGGHYCERCGLDFLNNEIVDPVVNDPDPGDCTD